MELRPNERLEFFVDRCLGKSIVTGLRDLGLTVHSMAEVYGEKKAQGIADRTWLEEVGRNDWVVLTKDDAIRRRPAELKALTDAGVRVFCLTAGSLKGTEQLERFAKNRHRIAQKARKPGPFIYGVYSDGVRQIWP